MNKNYVYKICVTYVHKIQKFVHTKICVSNPCIENIPEKKMMFIKCVCVIIASMLHSNPVSRVVSRKPKKSIFWETVFFWETVLKTPVSQVVPRSKTPVTAYADLCLNPS